MTALAADKKVIEKQGNLVSSPMAVDIIYQGALLKHNAAGFLAPCAAEAGAQFAGVAFEGKDNSAGSAGDELCRAKKVGMYLLNGTGFSQADVGSTVYASDDQTISTTQATNEQPVGKIAAFVSSTEVYVKIDGFAY